MQRQEGFLKLDRRKGAVISVDRKKLRVLEEMKREMAVVLARGVCNGVDREDAHALVDALFDEMFSCRGKKLTE